MSKIIYTDKVALNINSDIPDINKCNATDMNEIKEVVNENETKILLAVSSSAPATCETGDMYYNTTNDLIYTATGTNTWGSTGEEPTENTIYIVFDSQSAYAYDGNELISVGGGSGDLIMVDPDTPTASTKLYIESQDLNYQGLEIANSYNTSNSMAYSCAYLNPSELWTNTSTATTFAGQSVQIDLSGANTVLIKFYRNKSNNDDVLSCIANVGDSSFINYSDFSGSARSWNRSFVISSSDITFGDATLNGSTSNTLLIPYKVIKIN